MQIRAEVDRRLIAELQTEGVMEAEHVKQMGAALKSARTIGAAIGIVMATTRCTELQAFETLVEASNRTNRKLRDIADDLVLTGALPAS